MKAANGATPPDEEIDALRKQLEAVTKEFFGKYPHYDAMLIPPPGPRPPPKRSELVLNLFAD